MISRRRPWLKKWIPWIKKMKCIFIGYKEEMKGCKIWNPNSSKVVYNRDTMFREVKEVPRQEVTPMEKEPEKIEFELEGEESDSMEEFELEEEEPHTLVFRRSSQERRKPERYYLVAKLTSIRFLLSIVASFDLEVE